jgi:hypothetical protein
VSYVKVDVFLKYRGREGLSDRSGNSGYPCLAILVLRLQEMKYVGQQKAVMSNIIQPYLLHASWSFFGETNVLFQT